MSATSLSLHAVITGNRADGYDAALYDGDQWLKDVPSDRSWSDLKTGRFCFRRNAKRFAKRALRAEKRRRKGDETWVIR